MAKLPEDLIAEILLHLPVKSILRFQCLSKSICAVTNDLNFINSHLITSSLNFDCHKLIFQFKSPMIGRLSNEVTSRFDICDMDGGLEAEILLEKPSASLWKEVYGYCNGVLLLCRGLSKPALWNPSTRKYRFLSCCPYEIPDYVNTFGIAGLGLCFDSVDGYKVVFILILDLDPEDPSNVEIQVWVFTLRSNTWRRVLDFPYLDHQFDFPGPGFGYFADGALYWLCHPVDKVSGQSEKIVAFDAKNETFSVVVQPVYTMDGSVTGLHVLGGCLCITFLSRSMPRRAELYVRYKDGLGQFSWTRLLFVKEPLFFDMDAFRDVRVLGYSQSRTKILLDLGLKQLVSYDIERGLWKDEVEKNVDWYDPIVCVESLVKIDGGVLVV